MRVIGSLLSLTALMLLGTAARADDYTDATGLFRHAGQSADFFNHCYAYAIFPTIGKGGLIVGAAHGTGRVYVHGKYIGDSAMTQVSVGFQLGGQAYTQIVFFEDKHALDAFTAGDFEFDAGVSAVAITAAAGASAGTEGASGGASGGKNDAATAGHYYKGMAVFTIVRGGAMYEASLAGQKYSYKPRGQS
jgi:lipid-binding SYLF domain-containing protein